MNQGFVIWEGNSLIDQKPIVLIATLQTENPKTGNIIQTWILRADIAPVQAINLGEDKSICGDCPLRGFIQNNTNHGRGCYVAVQNAPRAIYTKYKNNGYTKYNHEIHKHLFKGRKIRLGAYGDPVAVPLQAWRKLLTLCKKRTGYTHQWKQKHFQRWKKYVMASTHTEQEVINANNNGWRSFRTLTENDSQLPNEIKCPASEEMKVNGQYKRTCESCMACNGCQNGNIRRNLTIIIHGGNKTKNAERTLTSLKVVPI